MANSGPRRGKYKGVSFNLNSGKWTAQITVNGVKRHLGSYATEQDAALAYDNAAITSFGSFAFTNLETTQMPIIQPDLSEVKSMGPIEPGIYKGKITAVEYKTSGKGNPMIVPTIEVEVAPEDKRTRNAYLVVTGAGAYGFEQLLRACGFDDVADKYRDPAAEKPAFDTDNLIGQELNVQIESDTYNGQMRDKIQSYLKA